MRSIPPLAAGALAATLAGCTPTPEPNPMVPPNYQAAAQALDASGQARADVALTQLDTGVRIVVQGYGLSRGVHGVHIHRVGRCDAPGFESAGDHWNPLDRQHGRDNPAGQHMGDMPNLIVGEDGRGVLEASLNGAQIVEGDNPIRDHDGAAVVIHLQPDDYRTDPSGNSGARVACGVIGLMEPQD